MEAMIVRSFGGPDVFEHAEIPRPEVQPGHVLVRIAATSVNTVDTMIRRMGSELPISPEPPAILGMDFAGTIEAVGEGVTEFAQGDEVYGCAGGLADLPGALAEANRSLRPGGLLMFSIFGPDTLRELVAPGELGLHAPELGLNLAVTLHAWRSLWPAASSDDPTVDAVARRVGLERAPRVVLERDATGAWSRR